MRLVIGMLKVGPLFYVQLDFLECIAEHFSPLRIAVHLAGLDVPVPVTQLTPLDHEFQPFLGLFQRLFGPLAFGDVLEGHCKLFVGQPEGADPEGPGEALIGVKEVLFFEHDAGAHHFEIFAGDPELGRFGPDLVELAARPLSGGDARKPFRLGIDAEQDQPVGIFEPVD